jgi:hypothetical protein
MRTVSGPSDESSEIGAISTNVQTAPCRYRKLDSDVLVMQSTEDRI